MDIERQLVRGAFAGALWLCGVLPVRGQNNVDAFVRRVVDSERAANLNDHSNWMYREEVKKPNDDTLQWVAATQHGEVRRVFKKDNQRQTDAQQRDAVYRFLHDAKAQKKEVEEDQHDAQQIDDFLKLLPVAFLWTEKSADAVNTTLHFEPDPKFIRRRARQGSSQAWWAMWWRTTSSCASAA